MDNERNNIYKKYLRAGQTPFLVTLLFVWLFAFAGMVSADDNPVPQSPPQILSHTPGIDAGQVPINGAISVVWDRPMMPDTNFVLTGPEGFLDGTFLYDSDTYTVSFRPDQNLMPDTRYGVLVVNQVDKQGQVQQGAYQWNFDTVSPTSVSIVSFNSMDEGLGQSWWWLTWPSLMAVISIFSLAGFFTIWSRRRSVV